MSETTTPRRRKLNLLSLALSAIGHTLATLTIFGVAVSAFMSSAVMPLLTDGLMDTQMKHYVFWDLGIMLGLSACVWALLFIAYAYVQQGRKQTRKMVVAKARGTVVTETLIVLPVFLLLSFGLGQMGLNSMAGLLTTLATFQASRTLAVWGPEVGNNRTGTTTSSNDATDRARIAAAAVLAPVAPMSAGNIACGKSSAFRKMVQGMVSAGLSPVEAPQRYSTFADSLETSTFAQRGPAKFAGAYCSTSVTHTGTMRTNPTATDVGQFTATVTYNHKMVFPLVGLAFGGTLTAGGWQTAMSRSYVLTHHLTPNPELPKANDIL